MILIIEDDCADYNDIIECLPESMEHDKKSDRKKSWEEIVLSPLLDGYDLCVTDIIKHKGSFPTFKAEGFKEKSKQGITNIANICISILDVDELY